MEKALPEAGLRLRCVEDFGGEGHNKSGEGKIGESRRVARVTERVFLYG